VQRAISPAPLVGAEVPVDDVFYTEEDGQQTHPFIAGGGPGALIVWLDDPLPGFAVSQHGVDFARIDSQGNLLDRLPVAIGTPTDAVIPEAPIAAWNGDQALVLWMAVTNDTELRGSRDHLFRPVPDL